MIDIHVYKITYGRGKKIMNQQLSTIFFLFMNDLCVKINTCFDLNDEKQEGMCMEKTIYSN